MRVPGVCAYAVRALANANNTRVRNALQCGHTTRLSALWAHVVALRRWSTREPIASFHAQSIPGTNITHGPPLHGSVQAYFDSLLQP